MFSWEKFLNGEICVKVNNEREFHKFISLCGEKNVSYVNGKICNTEALTEKILEVNGRNRRYLVNEEDVRRFTFGVMNYYVVINGTMRKKTRNSSFLENKVFCSVSDVERLSFIDEEGFEREIY